MKKHFLFVVLVAFMLGATSCEKELIYSCDPEIDKWTKENIVDIQKMTRSDWKQLDASKSRACYRAFSESQKLVFWQEKLNEVLALDLNDNEREHIGKLRTFVNENPHIFSLEMTENEILADQFELFMYQWIEYAKEELQWSEETISAIAASGHSTEVENGELVARPLGLPGINDSFGKYPIGLGDDDCNCNVDYDFCSGPESDCVDDGKCNADSHGCGWLWVQSCDGICKG